MLVMVTPLRLRLVQLALGLRLVRLRRLLVLVRTLRLRRMRRAPWASELGRLSVT